MNTLLSILALSLLAVLAWIAGYAVSLALLSLTQWSQRLQINQRLPAERLKKTTRLIATVVGLIVSAIALYYCAPATIRSL